MLFYHFFQNYMTLKLRFNIKNTVQAKHWPFDAQRRPKIAKKFKSSEKCEFQVFTALGYLLLKYKNFSKLLAPVVPKSVAFTNFPHFSFYRGLCAEKLVNLGRQLSPPTKPELRGEGLFPTRVPGGVSNFCRAPPEHSRKRDERGIFAVKKSP